MGGDSSQSHSVNSWRQDHHFCTEVEIRTNGWLFFFSDLKAEHQFLSLGFSASYDFRLGKAIS